MPVENNRVKETAKPFESNWPTKCNIREFAAQYQPASTGIMYPGNITYTVCSDSSTSYSMSDLQTTK